MADPPRKLAAGAALVCISTLVGILYKVSQAATGGFKYSTTSAIAIAEFVKFCMSCSFHILDKSHQGNTEDSGKNSAIASAIVSAQSQLSLSALGHIWFLSFLYTFNNQLSFFVYMLADPGTVFLFKAASTLIVACVQCTCSGKSFSKDQWKAMMLQGCGMVIVQYDPCKKGMMLRPLAYICMITSATVTAICAARNEYLVKNYKIGLNVQNLVLYAGGTVMNVMAFFFLPNPNSKDSVPKGFFEGFDDPLALGVVFANAMIGLAITAVYKYADAIVKCIAADITAVLLLILSTFFFGLKSSITMWCGVGVVVFAVHLYVEASQAPPSLPSTAPKDSSSGPDSSVSAAKKEDAVVSAADQLWQRNRGTVMFVATGILVLCAGGAAATTMGLGLDLGGSQQESSWVGVVHTTEGPSISTMLESMGVEKTVECLQHLKDANLVGRSAVASAVHDCVSGIGV
eukprot:gnl/TRDRNA2_/TRDRNA2_42693_c0_seq1.p1 gnl/TRDRNA2_/TRDRNA2_42693_c0~~gnl/TRDRNA2_/TRDRNA2_42693_c0_seq1.p1  ORF type:complete len:459 (+),score=79.24 gnl/TRDRNA2_/TRDRNA2_42693_c0_seq1:98-1474(+)